MPCSSPREPLIVLNVALTAEIPASLALIESGRGDVPEEAARVACFYSISATPVRDAGRE